ISALLSHGLRSFLLQQMGTVTETNSQTLYTEKGLGAHNSKCDVFVKFLSSELREPFGKKRQKEHKIHSKQRTSEEQALLSQPNKADRNSQRLRQQAQDLYRSAQVFQMEQRNIASSLLHEIALKHSDGKHLKEEVGYFGFWFQRNRIESIMVGTAWDGSRDWTWIEHLFIFTREAEKAAQAIQINMALVEAWLLETNMDSVFDQTLVIHTKALDINMDPGCCRAMDPDISLSPNSNMARASSPPLS
ncbi:hypothetical protein STEG23_017936, partial [Scotinomys teguina]